MKIKHVFLVTAMMIGGSVLFAQNVANKLAYHLQLGTMGYYGDLNKKFFGGFNVGGGVSYYAHKWVDVLPEISFLKVTSDTEGPNGNTDMAPRNFNANLIDFTVLGKVKFPIGPNVNEDFKVWPYLLAGIGGGFLIKSSGTGFLSTVSSYYGDFTEKSNLILHFDVGIGVRYRINNQFTIYLQTLPMILLSNSDIIDGWGKTDTNTINVLKNINEKNDFLIRNSIGLIFDF